MARNFKVSTCFLCNKHGHIKEIASLTFKIEIMRDDRIPSLLVLEVLMFPHYRLLFPNNKILLLQWPLQTFRICI